MKKIIFFIIFAIAFSGSAFADRDDYYRHESGYGGYRYDEPHERHYREAVQYYPQPQARYYYPAAPVNAYYPQQPAVNYYPQQGQYYNNY